MNSKPIRLFLLLAALLTAMLAAAEPAPRAANDFWDGLWDDEQQSREEPDFWAGLWDSGDEKPAYENPQPTAKPENGKLYKI